MRIIAIDSSGLVASVAVLDEDIVLAEYNVQFKKTHSQTLLPMLDEVKKMLNLDLNQIDAIAISKGPGSFTGLRIGSATAKGLAQALDKPIIEVSTLKGMACNLFGSDSLIVPIMDARRNQVYTGIYEFIDGQIEVLLDDCAISIEELIKAAEEIAEKKDKDIIFLGDGVPVYKEIINEKIKCRFNYAKGNMNCQRAASLGILAMDYLKAGETVDYRDHAPEYLRLSQAERERNEGIRNKGSNY